MEMIYRCELCGRICESKEEAEKHDERHITAGVIEIQGKWQDWHTKTGIKMYPGYLVIEMSDGMYGRYALQTIVKENA